MNAAATVPPQSPPLTLDRLSIGMFALLGIEFLLGMALALFVSLPTTSSVASFLESSPVLDLHILIAVFIVGISARAVALAHADARRSSVGASWLALGSALIATFAGADFAFRGQSPTASYVMAIGFLGVLLAAFVLRGGEAQRPSHSSDSVGEGWASAPNGRGEP